MNEALLVFMLAILAWKLTEAYFSHRERVSGALEEKEKREHEEKMIELKRDCRMKDCPIRNKSDD